MHLGPLDMAPRALRESWKAGRSKKSVSSRRNTGKEQRSAADEEVYLAHAASHLLDGKGYTNSLVYGSRASFKDLAG